MQNDSTKLVQSGTLQEVIAQQLNEQGEKVKDLEKIMPFLSSLTLRKDLTRELDRCRERVVALQAGFVPLDYLSWTADVNTRSSWLKKDVKETLDHMPQEVKDAWERIKEAGIFKKYRVSVRRGGDPMLIGMAGKWHFLIAAWVNLTDAYSIGYIVRLKDTKVLEEGKDDG